MKDTDVEINRFIPTDSCDNLPQIILKAEEKEKIKPKKKALKNWGQYSDIVLSKEDLDDIEEKIQQSEGDIQKSLQVLPANVKGVYISVIISFLFIALCLTYKDIETISKISTLVKDKYEKTPFDGDSYYADITTMDDIDKYIRKLLFPQCFIPNDINYATLVLGIRMTLRQYQVKEMPISEYKDVILNTIDYNSISEDINKIEEFKGNLGIWTYGSKAGYRGNGGYEVHFLNKNLELSINIWRIMKPFWLNQYMAQLDIEILIHSRNLEATLLYTQHFTNTPSGRINFYSTTEGVFYELYQNPGSSKVITITLLLLFYGIGLFIQICKISQNMARVFRVLLAKLKLDMEFFELLEFINISLTLSSFILIINQMVSRKGMFNAPFDKNEFDEFVNYINESYSLSRINGISCLLIMIQVTFVLKNKFPSFGILFDTIYSAKNDLVNFAIITLLLLLGFVFMGNLSFGPHHSLYKTIQGCFDALFITILSNVNYSDLNDANSTISSIFTIVYCILFYTILLNMFIAIVISNYNAVKEQGQLILEAKAAIVKKSSADFIQAITNLLFFRIKNTLEEDANEYKMIFDNLNPEGLSDSSVQERIKALEISIMQQYYKNYYAIFTYNIGQVQTLLKTGSLKTNEQVRQEIQNVIREIFVVKRKKQLFDKMLENNKYYNFMMIREMCISLIFIIILMSIILTRVQIYNTYHLTNIGGNVAHRDLLSNIVQENDVYDYFYDELIPSLQENSLPFFNYVINEPFMRITVNKYKLKKNTRDFSKDVIKDFIVNSKSFETENFRGENTQYLFLYEKPGGKNTFAGEGGYVFTLTQDEGKDIFFYLLKGERLASKKFASLTFEWIAYNINLDMFTYNSLTFTNDPSGQITNNLIITPMNLDCFNVKQLGAGVLEIFFAIIVIYYIYYDFRLWLKIWKKAEIRRKQKLISEKIVENIVLKLESKKTKKGCTSIFLSCFKNIKKCIFSLIKFLVQFSIVTYEYITTGIYTLLNVSSNGLSLAMLIHVLLIRVNDFRSGYVVGERWENLHGEFYELSILYRNYRLISAFLAFLSIMRLTQFFKFSSELSILTKILASAKIDLFFFLAMFISVHIGYAFMAYIILGLSLQDFHSIKSSILNCYLILFGKFDLEAISKADKYLGPLFFGSYIVLFYLLLLNMFTAIIEAHHDNISSEDHSKSMSFFQKIWKVFRSFVLKKCFKISKPKNQMVFGKLGENNYNLKNEHENYKQEFFIEEPPECLEQASHWFKVLVEILNKITAGKLKINKFGEAKNKTSDMRKHAELHTIVYFSQDIWKSMSCEEKISALKSMVILEQANRRMEIEKATALQEEIPMFISMSGPMKKLWESMSIEEQLEAWAGEKPLGDYERVCIWNTYVFNEEIFKILNLKPCNENISLRKNKWEPDTERAYWASLSFKEKFTVAGNIVGKVEKWSEKARKGLKELMKENLMELDMKERLWVVLEVNIDMKCELFINNPNEQSAEMIAMIMIIERKNRVFSLDGADKMLEFMLEEAVFRKIIAACYLGAEIYRTKNIEEAKNASDYDIKNLNSYKIGILEEIKYNKKARENYKNEFGDLYKKK